MNNFAKCEIPEHNSCAIIAFCYEQQCTKPRKLCEVCIGQHKKHDITTIKTDFQNIPLNILKTHYDPNNCNSNAQLNIDSNMSNLLDKCTLVIQSMQKLKNRCFTNHLFPMCELIASSFKENGHCTAVAKIIYENSNKQELNMMAKAIRCFEKPHLKNVHLLEQSVKCMTQQLSKIMDRCLEEMMASMSYIETSIKEWSVFEVQDYTNKIKEMDQSTKLIEQNRKQQLKAKQIQFIEMAKQQNWKPIIQWVEAGWFSIGKLEKLDELTSLQLIGNNIPKELSWVNATIPTNILKIEEFDVLKNLKMICLHCNNIQKIQNLSKLSQLEKLQLSANNIANIENLQALRNLKYLSLSWNQISKIQNLQTLSSLTKLYLTSNKITKIQNLTAITSLTTLGLSYNQISIIQNLSPLSTLTKLYLYENPIIKSFQNQTQAKQLQQRVTQVCQIANY